MIGRLWSRCVRWLTFGIDAAKASKRVNQDTLAWRNFQTRGAHPPPCIGADEGRNRSIDPGAWRCERALPPTVRAHIRTRVPAANGLASGAGEWAKKSVGHGPLRHTPKGEQGNPPPPRVRLIQASIASFSRAVDLPTLIARSQLSLLAILPNKSRSAPAPRIPRHSHPPNPTPPNSQTPTTAQCPVMVQLGVPDSNHKTN